MKVANESLPQFSAGPKLFPRPSISSSLARPGVYVVADLLSCLLAESDIGEQGPGVLIELVWKSTGMMPWFVTARSYTSNAGTLT